MTQLITFLFLDEAQFTQKNSNMELKLLIIFG